MGAVTKIGYAGTKIYFPRAKSIYKSYGQSVSCQQIKRLNISFDFLIC